MSSEEYEDFAILVEAVLEDRISAKGLERLKMFVMNDEQSLDYLIENLLLNSMLTVHGTEERLNGMAEQQTKEMLLEADFFESASASAPTISSKKSPNLALRPLSQKEFRRIAVLFCLIPILFMTAVYTEFFHRPATVRKEVFTATVTHLIDTEFDENTSVLKKGERIQAGRIELNRGTLGLEYANGVKVVLEGPTRYQVETPMEAACEQGKLSITVPEAAHGFSVMTSKMLVRDLGTAFFLDVEPNASELHVIEGEVEASWMDKTPQQLTRGRGIVVDENDRGRYIAAKQERFFRQDRLSRLSKEFESKQREIWQSHTQSLVAEPSLVSYLDFEDSWIHRNGISVTEGRWPEKRAAAFQAKDDVVVLDESCRCNALTLLASVRLDRLKNGTNILLTCRDFVPGAVQWQISASGTIQLLVGSKKAQSGICYESRPVITSSRFGVWLQLATVVDPASRSIRHYLDGREVAVLPFTEKSEFHLREMQVGNWIRPVSHLTDCKLEGRIDEFAVFKRALTQEELENMVIY